MVMLMATAVPRQDSEIREITISAKLDKQKKCELRI